MCDEFLDLCKRSKQSIFRRREPEAYVNFTWQDYGLELGTRAPVFYQLCKAIVGLEEVLVAVAVKAISGAPHGTKALISASRPYGGLKSLLIKA